MCRCPPTRGPAAASRAQVLGGVGERLGLPSARSARIPEWQSIGSVESAQEHVAGSIPTTSGRHPHCPPSVHSGHLGGTPEQGGAESLQGYGRHVDAASGTVTVTGALATGAAGRRWARRRRAEASRGLPKKNAAGSLLKKKVSGAQPPYINLRGRELNPGLPRDRRKY